MSRHNPGCKETKTDSRPHTAHSLTRTLVHTHTHKADNVTSWAWELPPSRPPGAGDLDQTPLPKPTTSSPGAHWGLVVIRWGPQGAEADKLVHGRPFHEETRDSQSSPAGKAVLTKALDVHFTLSALPDVPGHKHQTQGQTFNTRQALLRRRSWAMGLWPGDCQPPSGEVTATPSGHSGKAPSEQGAAFWGRGGGRQKVGSGLQRPKERRGGIGPKLPQLSSSQSWHMRESVPLFLLKDWGKGTRRTPGGNFSSSALASSVGSTYYSKDPEIGCSCRTGSDGPYFSLIPLETRELNSRIFPSTIFFF